MSSRGAGDESVGFVRQCVRSRRSMSSRQQALKRMAGQPLLAQPDGLISSGGSNSCPSVPPLFSLLAMSQWRHGGTAAA